MAWDKRWSAGLVVAALCGGLGGSVFTWWMNLPQATRVAFSITTSTLSADPKIKSVVPDLKIQIRKRELRAIYVTTVEFTVPDGPHVDHAEVALPLEMASPPESGRSPLQI